MHPALFAIVSGLIVSVIGFGLLAWRKPILGTILIGASTVVDSLILYAGMPSTAYPLWGWVGGVAIINLIIGTIVAFATTDDYDKPGTRAAVTSLLGTGCVVLLLCFVTCRGHGCYQATTYADLIGEVQEREWKEDFQPINPKHIALVPYETASFLADKELGEAEGGAIGSQYHLDKNYMTLQRVNGHLWWVVPLDFDGFLVWWNSKGTPGYVMVDAENPRAKPRLILGHQFVYTPGAYFGDELKRHLWSHGYSDKVLTDYSFEIDEDGKPWWIVTAYVPTISYFGPRVLGVAQVDPQTGATTFFEKGKVPEWVDRVVPSDLLQEWVNDWGQYWKAKQVGDYEGWKNSWSAKDNIRKVASGPGDDIWIVYGNDGEPYWTVGITSASSKDGALVGVMYVNARTGEVRYYKMAGQAEQKIADIIHNKVKFQNLRPARLYLFNVGHRQVWFSTLIGEAGTFNGTALVDADTSELFVGEDEETAFRLFEAKNWQGTAKIDPSAAAERLTAQGKVFRVGCPVINGGTVCFVRLESGLHVTGSGTLTIPLTQTRDGDEIRVEYVKSDDPTQPYGLVSAINLTLLGQSVEADSPKL